MTHPKAKKLVLVVDDDPSVRRLLAAALVAKGYDVREADNGLAASETLGALTRAPELIICDVMMPVVDGFSFVKTVKSRSEMRAVPVIFLTAKTQPADIARGIALGARHYIQKPFSVADLLDKVKKTLGD